MALNVKAAMLVCMGFVGGMSWFLHGAETTPVTRQSPLAAQNAGAGPALSRAATGWRVPGVAVDRPAVWAQRFEQASVVDPSLVIRRNDVPLAYAPAATPATDEQAAMPMPILVSGGPVVPDEPVVAVAPAPAVENRVRPQPTGDVRLVADAPVESDSDAAEATKAYRVAKGDTLMRILRREWNSSDSRLLTLIVAANPQVCKRPGQIRVGEELLLPDDETAMRVLAGEWTPEEGAAHLRGAAGRPATVVDRWYTIQPNDSLTSIAQRFLNDSRRWREILELNDDLDPDRIFPGVRIKLPPAIRLAVS